MHTILTKSLLHLETPLETGLLHATRIDTHWRLPLQFYVLSWRWTRTASETCRVIINQVKQKLHLVVYLLIQYCYSPTRLNGIKLGSNFIFCPSVTHQDSFSAHDVVSVPRFLSHLQFLFFFVLFSFFFFPSYLWFFLVLFSLPSSSSSCSSSSSTTIRRGSWLPIQSSIRSGVWPLYASFFVLLPADPLQPHESILSVVFLFLLFLRLWQSLFVWHSFVIHRFSTYISR